MTVALVLLWARIAVADPFVGTWKMRPNPHGAVVAQTIAIDTSAVGYTWSYDVTLRNQQHLQFALVIDTKTKTLTLQTRDGHRLGAGHYRATGATSWAVESPRYAGTGSIAADGKTMTVHETVPAEVTLVFDKL